MKLKKYVLDNLNLRNKIMNYLYEKGHCFENGITTSQLAEDINEDSLKVWKAVRFLEYKEFITIYMEFCGANCLCGLSSEGIDYIEKKVSQMEDSE